MSIQPTILRKLSPEIRLMILELAMSDWDSKENKSPPILKALIGQEDLYHEALEVFYRTCSFTVSDDHDVKHMIMKMESEKLARIRKLTLQHECFDDMYWQRLRNGWHGWCWLKEGGQRAWYHRLESRNAITRITRSYTSSPVGKVVAYAENVTELFVHAYHGAWRHDGRIGADFTKLWLQRFPKLRRLIMQRRIVSGCYECDPDEPHSGKCACAHALNDHLGSVGRVNRVGARTLWEEWVWEVEAPGKKFLVWMEEGDQGFGSQRVRR